MVAVHRGCGRPGEIVVQHLSQNTVAGESDIGESQIEAGNRPAIHFIVLPIPTVNLDDASLVTIGIGIRRRATECFGPIRGESLDMLRVEAMAERMGYDFVGHDALMPSVGKTAHAVVATRGLEENLHVPMMTILFVPCKMTAVKSSQFSPPVFPV